MELHLKCTYAHVFPAFMQKLLRNTAAKRIGNQDVLFINEPRSRRFYNACYIEGTADFIFDHPLCCFGLARSLVNEKRSRANTTKTILGDRNPY